MYKTLFFLTALAIVQARLNEDAVVTNVRLNKVPVQIANADDDCETLDNGCPVDFTIHKLVPHEEYCHLFYYCDKGELVLSSCPEPLYFDPKAQVCVWSWATDCVNNGPYTYPTTAAPEVENSTAPGTIDIGEVLDNGCPSDIHIHHHLPHEECEKFYQCNFGQKVERDCAPGTVFHFEIQVCDWPRNVPRCAGSAGATARPQTTPEASSEEIPTSNDPVEWESLPNGCPVDSSIHHLLPHESVCDKYYACDNGRLVEIGCASGTHFSPAQQVCTWPHEAGCEHWTGGGGCSTPGDNGGSCGGSTAVPISPTTPVSNISTTPVPDNITTTTTKTPETTTPVSDNSTTPVYEITTTPVSDNSTTPVSDNSTTPVYEITTTPVSDNSTTPVSDNSTTPVYEITTTPVSDNSTTPVSDNSTTPVYEITTTPVSDNSTTPVSDNSTTPVYEITTTPVSDNSTTPVSDNSTTPVYEITTTPVSDIETTTTTKTPEVSTTTTSAPDCDTEGTVTEDPITEDSTPESNSSEEVPAPADPELPGTTTNSPPAPSCPECPTVPLTPAEKCKQGCNVAPWAHAECDKYYSCIGNEFRLNICSEGLHFNPSTLTCDFICNAGCDRNIPQVTRHEDGMLIFVPHSFNNKANMLELIEHELNEEF
uniref:Insect intestinal mucin 4 n=1 Tax=Mamestra configurata TaxID=174822 RepID=C0L9E0_9NEOP|nr:insect intestinal mucin 4 [Mamestra configurata]